MSGLPPIAEFNEILRQRGSDPTYAPYFGAVGPLVIEAEARRVAQPYQPDAQFRELVAQELGRISQQRGAETPADPATLRAYLGTTAPGRALLAERDQASFASGTTPAGSSGLTVTERETYLGMSSTGRSILRDEEKARHAR